MICIPETLAFGYPVAIGAKFPAIARPKLVGFSFEIVKTEISPPFAQTLTFGFPLEDYATKARSQRSPQGAPS